MRWQTPQARSDVEALGTTCTSILSATGSMLNWLAGAQYQKYGNEQGVPNG